MCLDVIHRDPFAISHDVHDPLDAKIAFFARPLIWKVQLYFGISDALGDRAQLAPVEADLFPSSRFHVGRQRVAVFEAETLEVFVEHLAELLFSDSSRSHDGFICTHATAPRMPMRR